MKPGMLIQRAGSAVFAELPHYVGYLGVVCWRCEVTNTTFEVYSRGIETNCLSCARGKHPIPASVRDWVSKEFWKRGEQDD